MKTFKSFHFFLFGLIVAPCLPFLCGTLNAQDISQSQDLHVSDNSFSTRPENIVQETESNITHLNNRSKANFILNWGEYLYPGLFPSGPMTQYMAHLDVFYRAYSTNLLLGTYQDHVYLVDQESQLTDCGAVDDLLTMAQSPNATQVFFGYVYSSVSLDRDPGQGNCGTGPWADPNCIDIKIWWKMYLEAFALSPVLIIPDGENRWVITNMSSVGEKYGVSLPDSSNLGEYTRMVLDPSVTHPECTVFRFEGADFSFQIMGTRENGLTELILSSNPVESTEGTCMQAAFAYDTTWLLNGWAAGLSGDPTDLRVELNDTFMDSPGQYTFARTTDTNPSPENRDHVSVELGLICTESIDASGMSQTIPCPWE